MSGHSKWHNIENSFLTAPTVLEIKYVLLAQFWHNSFNKELQRTIIKMINIEKK